MKIQIPDFTSRRGFTLIELLVVIAIIALLAAILFPVFARARENARKSSCLNNMKQISVGVLQYIQDSDEIFPISRYSGNDNPNTLPDGEWGPWQRRWTGWNHLVLPYAKSVQVFRCPSASRPGAIGAGGNNENQTGQINYYINRQLGGSAGNTTQQAPLADLTWPAATIMIGEGPRGESCCGESNWTNGWGYTDGHDNMNASDSTGGAVAPTKRHLGGANYAFADGHVKWYSADAVNYLQVAADNPRNGKGPTFWQNATSGGY